MWVWITVKDKNVVRVFSGMEIGRALAAVAHIAAVSGGQLIAHVMLANEMES